MGAIIYLIAAFYLAVILNTFTYGVSHAWSFTCGWVSAITIISILLVIYKGLEE